MAIALREPVGAQAGGRHRNVVQEAEPGPASPRGVVPGRPDDGERDLRLARRDRDGGLERGAGRQPRRSRRAGHEVGVGVEPAAASILRPGERGEVAWIVGGRQRCLVDLLGGRLDERVPCGVTDPGGHSAAALWSLGMAGGLVGVHRVVGQEPDAHGRMARTIWSVPSKSAYITSDSTAELVGSPPGVAMIANSTMARIAHRRRADRNR